uniref:Uncharacterized protein n=1 Tax=Arundo donax TaxID=35708 RepID=A0A0A9AY06_ARUDO
MCPVIRSFILSLQEPHQCYVFLCRCTM